MGRLRGGMLPPTASELQQLAAVASGLEPHGSPPRQIGLGGADAGGYDLPPRADPVVRQALRSHTSLELGRLMMRSHPTHRKLTLESLESRSLLAGDILAGAAACEAADVAAETSDIAPQSAAFELPAEPIAPNMLVDGPQGIPLEEYLADQQNNGGEAVQRPEISAPLTETPILANEDNSPLAVQPLEETNIVEPPVLVDEQPDFLGSPWLTLSRRPLAVNLTATATPSLQEGDAPTTSETSANLTSEIAGKWRLAR